MTNEKLANVFLTSEKLAYVILTNGTQSHQPLSSFLRDFLLSRDIKPFLRPMRVEDQGGWGEGEGGVDERNDVEVRYCCR